MIIAEATRAATPAVPPLSSGPPPRLGQSVEAIGAEVATLARTDPAAAQARYAAADATLSPVDRGALARIVSADFDIPGLPGLPGLQSLPSLPSIPGLPGLPDIPGLPGLPGLPHIPNPIDVIKETIEKIGDGLEALRRGAEAIKEKLENLPHELADKVADSMRGDKARKLTPDERAAIKEAYGDRVDIDKVRIVDGPGNSPIAKAAFEIGGNPAITVGNTIYIRHDRYAGDLTQSGKIETLVHEFSHVVQYKEMGYGSFSAKYAADLAKYHGDRNEVYRYDKRDTTFAQETIEGQAQMVGDYAKYRNSTDPQDQAKAADIAKRLKGTGIYGL